ncbi:hypothetical protein FRC20_005753 [Serendipita sp. 405]|nr:hypothetical protein FRC20_005753 [Serendipita sp. 405]
MMRAWWRSVHQSLVKSSRWFTASLATQAAWAIIAFAFTWIDAFGSSKIGTKVTAHGLAIALCWSWVVVIVLGWFFAGVSFSSSPLTDAIEQADDAYSGALPRLVAYERPRDRQDRYHFVFTRRIAGDVEHPGPIYNYARVLVWSHMTYHMVEAIRHQMSRPRILLNQEQNPAPKQDRPQQQDQYEQEKQYEQHENQMGHGRLSLRTRAASDVHTSITLVTSPTSVQGSKDEQGTLSQNNVFEREEGIPIITRYLWEDARGSARWKHDAYSRMAWATVCAITLSVMTVGSAFGLDFSTPSVGLGCRSGGVLIYWMVSYIILIVMVLAALISDQWSAHEAKVRQYQTQVTSLHRATSRVLGILAVSLRLFGKLLACANSVWIILHCLFEFTSFYDRCYCLTNRGTTFWLWFDDARIRSSGHTGRFWVGFASATGFTCLFYIAFMLAWTTKQL